jgi:hypothetical protein
VQSGADLSPEECVEAFCAYQRDLEQLRRNLAPALERYGRGEGREIDYEQLKAEVRQRLADEGITDASAAESHARRKELERLRAEIQPAIECFRHGEGEELDFDQLEADVIQRLAEKGIVD